MTSLKPSKPDVYEGKRDALAVNSWIYQVETYLNLLVMSNPELNLTEEMKVQYASTLLKKNAANWYYMKVHSNNIPQTWEEFRNEIQAEFVPQDSIRRQRDKINKLTQTSSVASYLESFRNIVLSIADMSEAEKLDKFLTGLKPMIRLEVLKSGCTNINDASRIALNVDSALYGSGMFQSQNAFNNSFGPQPMEIGNIQRAPQYKGNSYRGKKKGMNAANKSQKATDIANGTCFVCHKKGCRARNHYNNGEHVSNNNSSAKKVRFAIGDESLSEQEN